MTFLSTLAGLLVVLGILVFIHEAGHFVAAKWAGIWVHRFSLGLGSPIKALSVTRGGTEYCISWLPLGGYVKMASREEEATTSALEGGAVTSPVPPGRYYEDQPVWKRVIVTLAGVAMNAGFAWVAFVVLAMANGRQVNPETRIGRVASALPTGAEALARLRPGDRITLVNGRPVASWDDVTAAIVSGGGKSVAITVNDSLSVALRIPADALNDRAEAALAIAPWQAAVIGTVLPLSPAAKGGLQAGDTVVAVDGRPVTEWYDLVDILRASPGKALQLELGRAGGRTTVSVTPEAFDTAGQKIGRVGIGAYTALVSTRYGVLAALRAGTSATGQAALTIVRTVQGLATRKISAKTLGGPIMIGQIAAESAKVGPSAFLGVLGLISINLALLNLLPIPVLDGGQLIFLVYEAAFRRPMPLRWREALMLVGVVLVVLLMLVANWNDVRRIFGW
ncbi:MAG TPA: RIP metalloprotease RseP [Gemmatimonadales bacterium]|nr:RIP metalloprotease RseP [Gemmatimonadales bacterium]